jgi:hypothetical protein
MYSTQYYDSNAEPLVNALSINKLPEGDALEMQSVISSLNDPDPLAKYPAIRAQIQNIENARSAQTMSGGVKATQDLDEFNRITLPLRSQGYKNATSLVDKWYDPDAITGPANVGESMVDRTFVQKQRVMTTVDNVKESGLGAAYKDWLNRIVDTEIITTSQAEQMAKAMGLDLKWNTAEVKKSAALQRIEKELSKKQTNENMARYAETYDPTFLQKAQIFGAGMVAGFAGTPLDAAATAALALAPELMVGTAAKAAGMTKNAMKTQAVLESIGSVNRARTAAAVMESATSAENTGLRAYSLSRYSQALRGPQARQASERLITSAKLLENVSNLKYGNLTATEKTGLDVLTFMGGDIPLVTFKKYNSDEIGTDLYTGKDALIEILSAGALGTVLPGAMRATGKALGIYPAEISIRKMDEAISEIQAKRAMGEIPIDKADSTIKALKEMKNTVIELQKGVKQQHPLIKNNVDYLQRTNIDNETITARLALTSKLLSQGQLPRISDLPMGRTIFSHFDFDNVLVKLNTDNAEDVFGNNILREVTSDGIYKVRVNGESGLLGLYQVSALSDREALDQLRNIYKGSVLGNEQALNDFYNFYFRYQDFADELKRIDTEYKRMWDANTEARDKKQPIPYSTEALLNLEELLKDAYLKYKLGDGKSTFDDALSDFNYKKSTGEIPESSRLTEYEDVMSEAQAFADRYVISEKREKGTIYDFKDASGKKSRNGLSSLLEQLDEGAANNAELAGMDEMLSSMDAQRVENFLEGVNKGIFVEDTDLNRILGTPIKNFDDLKKMDIEATEWNKELNIQRTRIENLKTNEEFKVTFNRLEKFSGGEGNTYSIYKAANKALEDIDALKLEGFVSVKNAVLDSLRQDSSLGESFSKVAFDAESGNKTPLAHIEHRVSEVVSSVLGKQEFSVFINSSEVTKRVVDSFMEIIKEDPKVLKTLLEPEEAAPEKVIDNTAKISELESKLSEIKNGLKLNDKGGKKTEGGRQYSQELREQYREIKGQLDELKAPPAKENIEPEVAQAQRLSDANLLTKALDSVLDAELSRIQLQALNDIRIMTNKMHLMLNHPEIAAEVLTSGATQTIYNFTGANRSLENIKKSSVAYVNALLNELNTIESKDATGLTLKDYFLDKDNKRAIQEAFIKLKHGDVDGNNNSDAQRIAEVLSKHEATLNAGMNKYGSNYSTPMDFIETQKLKYSDSAITDGEINQLSQQMNLNENLNVNTLIEQLAPDGTMRYGDTIYSTPEEIKSFVSGTFNRGQKVLDSFFSIEDPVYRKVALWAFRDFDLDKMFNKEGRARIGYNKVRDAVLTGDWNDVLAGDYSNFRDAVSDLIAIRNRFLGEAKKFSTFPDTTKWVYSYLAGFDNIGQVRRGKKAAYLDAYDRRISFKDSSSEMHAIDIFGYEDVRRAVQRNADGALKARYVLETFGSRPMEMAQELMNAYEAIRVKDSDFSKKLHDISTSLTATEKAPDKPGNRFAITEEQRRSTLDFIEQACGMQELSPSGFVRWLKATQNILSSPMLMKAGLKSFADYGTIWQNLVNNALVDGRIEAAATTGRAIKLAMNDPEMFRLINAAGIIEQENLLQKWTNDPLLTLTRASENASALDYYEYMSNNLINFMFNGCAHISDITNSNKQVAGMAIQMSIGKASKTSFAKLPKNMQLYLNREGLDAADWNLLRTQAVMDVSGSVQDGLGEFLVYNPFKISEIPDEIITKTLREKGELNINKTMIDDYRGQLWNKGVTLIDSAADEMVSLPSERTMSAMRLKLPKGSTYAALVEMFTQFKSFGASMAYNTYGRIIANSIAGECGITVLDMFNPMVKVNWALRQEMMHSLFKGFLTIGLAMTVVDTAVDAMVGRIELPITEDGKPNLDLVRRRLTGPLGLGGEALDTFWEAVDGTGQGAGGIALHVFPSGSNLVRTISSLTRPLRSSDVENKPAGFGAAVVQEAAKMTGIRNFPIIAPIYQYALGSYMDLWIKGGPEDYYDMLRGRERRGQLVLPWEENPQPIWDRL